MPRKKKTTKRETVPLQLFGDPRILNRVLTYIGKPFFFGFYIIAYILLILPIATGYFYGTQIRPFYKAFFATLSSFVPFVRKKKVRYSKKAPLKGAEVKPRFNFISILLIFCTFLFMLSTVAGGLFYVYILKDLPSPENLTERPLPVSTKIYDRNGVLLYTIYKDHNRTPIELSKIPLEMKLATLAIEDAEFYDHAGFSVRGIVRSLKRNIERGELTGGSTITQQLVKNTLLSSEKTLTRKVKELLLAVWVEKLYSKDEILEMYLNEVSFGGTAYGVQEAAITYFGKEITEINLAEGALLAGLPRSPTRYSPFGNNPEQGITRQKEVLHLMVENRFITEEQKREAEETNIVFAEYRTDMKAPHFVTYIRELIEEQYGKDMVAQGGLSVTTSLDYEVQKVAEQILSEELEKLKKLRVGNGAVLVLKPKTGEILAMVGSKDYFDVENDGNVNVTLRERQPGSSIKVVNYAYALTHGMSLATILEDTPVTFLVDGQEPYSPKNYEGSYRGKITLRNALAESRNIPAVRILHANGITNMIEFGRNMGITSWTNPNNYGLSLTLGGGEVTLLDLSQVYATFANSGAKPPITPILNVSNYKGEILHTGLCVEKIKNRKIANIQNTETVTPTKTNYPLTYEIFDSQVLAASNTASIQNETNCVDNQVIDPRVAFLITDILKDNNARSQSFGTNSLLVVPKHPEVAVKTGTSNDLRDNLAIGYTRDYVVAVWVGNNDNSQMSRIASGVTGATPIWNKIMASLIADKPTYEWPIPQGLVKSPICPYTGTLACNGCPNREEWFLEETRPTISCRNLVTKHEEKNDENKNPDQGPKPQVKREIIDLREVREKVKERGRKFLR